jgi:outer membrane protein TolC
VRRDPEQRLHAANIRDHRASQSRRPAGRGPVLNVVAAQVQLLQSENDLADSDTQVAIDLVNLYRALGGEWEFADVIHDADSPPRTAGPR